MSAHCLPQEQLERLLDDRLETIEDAALARHDPQASLERMREHIEAYATYAQRKFPEVLDQIISWDRQPG